MQELRDSKIQDALGLFGHFLVGQSFFSKQQPQLNAWDRTADNNTASAAIPFKYLLILFDVMGQPCSFFASWYLHQKEASSKKMRIGGALAPLFGAEK